VNDTWLEVVGVLSEQLMAGAQFSGGKMQDLNNIVYIPLNTFQYRFWDASERNEGRSGRHRPAPEAGPTAWKWPRW
jgi:hypothetical protein